MSITSVERSSVPFARDEKEMRIDKFSYVANIVAPGMLKIG